MKSTKRLKKQKVKLTEDDVIQALDYSNVLMVSFYETMLCCQALRDPDSMLAFEKVGEAMADLYQTIGKIKYDGDNSNE